MQYSTLSGTDNDEVVIPPLKEKTQDEKDLELLQK
jgi:hypothetical protein